MAKEFELTKVKDQLGRPNDTTFTTKRFKEPIKIRNTVFRVFTKTLGNAWIVGSSTNGLVGANTSTQGGGQQVVGGNGRVQTLVQVSNKDKTYIDDFTTNMFKKSSTTTADWDASSGKLKFTSGEVAESEPIAYKDGLITFATITIDLSTGSSSDLTVQLTADGNNYETVTLGEKHSFTNIGETLQFKITSSGTVEIDKLTIRYG